MWGVANFQSPYQINVIRMNGPIRVGTQRPPGFHIHQPYVIHRVLHRVSVVLVADGVNTIARVTQIRQVQGVYK